MTLYELGCEYDKTEALLTACIDHATASLQQAEKAGEAQRAYEIKTYRQDLYEQRKETREIASKLKRYYATTVSEGSV